MNFLQVIDYLLLSLQAGLPPAVVHLGQGEDAAHQRGHPLPRDALPEGRRRQALHRAHQGAGHHPGHQGQQTYIWYITIV